MDCRSFLVVVVVSLVIFVLVQGSCLKIVMIFIILVDMVCNVVGDCVEVVLIIKLGVEIYNYEFIFSDLIGVCDVQLILCNGLNFELWFE